MHTSGMCSYSKYKGHIHIIYIKNSSFLRKILKTSAWDESLHYLTQNKTKIRFYKRPLWRFYKRPLWPIKHGKKITIIYVSSSMQLTKEKLAS